MAYEYKRIEERKPTKDVDSWLESVTKDGWRIKKYQENVMNSGFIHITLLLEREVIPLVTKEIL